MLQSSGSENKHFGTSQSLLRAALRLIQRTDNTLYCLNIGVEALCSIGQVD